MIKKARRNLFSLPILFVIFCLMIACNSGQPKHNDLTEYGFRGRIKNATALYYKDIVLSSGNWQAADTLKWYKKVETSYNEDGNTVEVISTYRMKELGDKEIVYTNRYQYDSAKRSGLTFRGDQKIGRIEEKWLDAKTYKSTHFDTDNQSVWISTVSLSPEMRELTSESKQYSGDSLQVSARYENQIDSEKRLIKRTTTDLKTNERKDRFFDYKDFDQVGNPLIVWIRDKAIGEPTEIAVRSYQYYP